MNGPVKDCRLRTDTLESFLTLPAHKTLFRAEPDCGLPIGNLTSQFFANVYLDALDQFVKHTLKAHHYVRYCDDFVLLSQRKEELERWKSAIEDFLGQHLQLRLNHKVQLQPINNGIDFLGYVIRPCYLLIRNRVVHALHDRLIQIENQLMKRGMVQHPCGRQVYPWPWEMLEQMRTWILSYQGHFRHATQEKPWQEHVSRFGWITEYYKINKWPIEFRLPTPRYVRFISDQKKYFQGLLPDHVLMFQFGPFWEMSGLYPAQTPLIPWFNKRISEPFLTPFKTLLWRTNLPVAWIAETGRSVTTIRERVVMERWTGYLSPPD